MAEINVEALNLLSYGLYIVTSAAGGRKNGQIANTVMQVCASPARVVVCLNKNTLTHELLAQGGVFGVSILEEAAPLTFIGLFGFKTGRDVDKFATTAYKTGASGVPLVTDNALAVLEAKVFASLDVGTHTLFAADVVGAEILKAGTPLTYAHYHDVKKGKTPAGAPTSQAAPPSKEAPKTGMTKYVCDVCGYVYDPAAGDPDNGVAAGTPFEKLPTDWVCPVCGATKDHFYPEG